MLLWLMGKVARCVIRKDFEGAAHYQPDVLNDVIESWIAEGNVTVGPRIPKDLACLPELADMVAKDPDFQRYGIHVHLSDLSVEYFQKNLRRHRCYKSGELTGPANVSFVQETGLTMTQKAETLQAEREIRRAVLGG